MGHRAHLVEENEDGTFTRTYSHWGAARITDLPNQMFHSEKDVDMDALNEKFDELKEKSHQDDEKTSSDIQSLIDPSDICIEAIIIKTQSNSFIIGLTIINGDYPHVLFRKIDDLLQLYRLECLKNRVSAYIRTAQKQGLEPETIKDGIRTTLSDRHARDDFDIVLTPVDHGGQLLSKRETPTKA